MSKALQIDTSTPVLLLGGQANSLAIARHLGKHGIHVSVSGRPGCWAMRSRYCRKAYVIPRDKDIIEYWEKLLLTPASNELHGHVVIACNDEALEFIIANSDTLKKSYILEAHDPALHHKLLDKQTTIDLARAADVPAPHYWPITKLSDAEALRDQIELPVIIKPIHSHLFMRKMKTKLFIIEESFDELLSKVEEVLSHDLEIMIVELIPGGDDKLCSYFTYVTDDGEFLFDFTKSVVRRFPNTYGAGACHVTEWQPDVAEMGRKFLKNINFRGLGNVEFKRDGELKVIEVNSRFAASHELIVRSGAPIDLIVYCHLTGQHIPTFESYDQGRYLWEPLLDTRAFLQMRRNGQLGFRAWVADLFAHKIATPYFQWRDPMPFVHWLRANFRGALKRR